MKKYIFFHPNISLILKTLLLNVLLFAAFRVFFFVKYHGLFSAVGLNPLIISFLNGLRFDLSTIFQIYSLLFLILLLPGRWVLSKIVNALFRWLTAIFIALQIIVLYSDIEYYSFVRRHFAMDILNILSDISSMAGLVLSSYLLPLIAAIFLIAAASFLVAKFLKQDDGALKSAERRPLAWFLTSFIHIFLLIAVSIVFWRGGLQSKPLRVSYAFTNDNIALGHLTLNGIYTMFQAMYKSGLSLNIKYDYDTAVKNVQGILKTDNEEFLNPDYPLLRKSVSKKKTGKKGAEPPNVVIFILESWSGDSVGALGSKKGLTPSFDAIAKEGHLFTNLFSVGQRSLDAVVSVLSSFPSFSGCTVVGKVYEQNGMLGIGNILKKQGYETLFICGAKRGSMGFDAFSSKIGFDRYISKEDFNLPKECFDGAWGVFDEYAFLRADEEFNKMKKPFLAVLYTLNPHAPYTIPSDKFKKVKEGDGAAFDNALYYCDWAIGEYFKKARESEYFKNTIFVLVADHCEGHHENSVIDSFRVPCLFYSPALIKPAVDKNVASQLDILPGILDVLGIEYTQSSMGKTPFQPSEKNRAFISYGTIFGWINDDYVFLHSGDNPVGLYSLGNDREIKNNLAMDNSKTAKKSETELFSFLKVTETLLKRNRIAPTSE